MWYLRSGCCWIATENHSFQNWRKSEHGLRQSHTLLRVSTYNVMWVY